MPNKQPPPEDRYLTFITPKYWGLWCLIGIMRLLVLFPLNWQLALGRKLGRLLQKLSQRRNDITHINLQRCFPKMSAEERQVTVDQHFEALGMGLVETAYAWWGNIDALMKVTEVRGLEHMQGALKKGKGAILLLAHFTSLEISGKVVGHLLPCHGIYFKHGNPLFDLVMRNGRKRSGIQTVPHSKLRTMLRSLKDNYPFVYLPDQDFGKRASIFVPFFDINTATTPATAKLAELSGAAVVPFFPQRRTDGQGYIMTFYPPLTNFPSGNSITDTMRINQVFEENIRQAIPQYLWCHRRFKTRPNGESGFY
jgi:Kdo2-lipid IVA lauroyltransferase/acyltransferase